MSEKELMSKSVDVIMKSFTELRQTPKEEDVIVVSQSLAKDLAKRFSDFDWYDVGTVDNYFRAKRVFEKSISYSIPKTNGEFLYKVNDNFIKLSSDENFISGRIKRANNLNKHADRKLVPE